jgi:hypothetical protein
MHVWSEAEPTVSQAEPPAAAVAQPARVEVVAGPRGRGLFRSPTVLLTLLALIAIAGLIAYTAFQRGSDAEYARGAETERPEAAGSAAADEEPVLMDAPADDQLYSEAPAEPDTSVESPAAEVAAVERPSAAEVSEEAVAEAPPTAAAEPEGAGEQGSALATVRAFYSALGAGDGASAAQLVVPGKRRSGPLSAGELSRYYSSFKRPLRVRRMTAVDADTVRVAYDYVLADGRLCQGQAAVNVARSGDRALVSGIRAQGPC